MKLNTIENINIETSLLFIRNTKKDYHVDTYFPKKLAEDLKKLKTISEYRNGDYYIDYFNVKLEALDYEDWDIIEKIINFEEVILRCRGLRTKSFEDAKILVIKASKFFIDFFCTNSNIKNIYSTVVDSFIMDVMFRVAAFYDVNVISYVRFFVPGYFRVTRYGENLVVRKSQTQEVQNLVNKLKSDEKSFMAISLNKRIRIVVPQYFKNKFKYLFFYLILNKMFSRKEWRYQFSDYNRGVNNLFQLFAFKYFRKSSNIDFNSNSILIPLHYYPEATVDYWVKDRYYADYENTVFEVISYLSSLGYNIIVKEHPAFVFQRKMEFYSRVSSLSNVQFVNPYESTQQLLKKLEKVIVWTGSSGIEALVRGKEVYVVTENYYSDNLLPNYKELKNKNFQYPNINIMHLIQRVLDGTIVSD